MSHLLVVKIMRSVQQRLCATTFICNSCVKAVIQTSRAWVGIFTKHVEVFIIIFFSALLGGVFGFINCSNFIHSNVNTKAWRYRNSFSIWSGRFTWLMDYHFHPIVRVKWTIMLICIRIKCDTQAMSCTCILRSMVGWSTIESVAKASSSYCGIEVLVVAIFSKKFASVIANL